MKAEAVRIEDGGNRLVVCWSDGEERRIPAVWLRDNLSEGRHREGGQKLFDISLLQDPIQLASAALADETRLELSFAGGEGAAAVGTVPLDMLRRGVELPGPRLWHEGFAPHRALFDDLQVRPQVLRDWLRAIRRDGVAIAEGLPCVSGALERVASLFGYLRQTNYGVFFDVIAEEDPENLANSGLGLGLHSDNPYRDPVPQLQLLHCLTASLEGGETVLVDGFAAAERLREEDSESFDLLCRHEVPFAYRAQGVRLESRSPLIETDSQGQLTAVRYNNRSVAPFDLPQDVIEPFYSAYRRFGALLQQPSDLQISFRLEPGELLVIDNRRVLHGRKSFAGGRRHLQGAYADKDSLLSKLRVLEEECGV